MTIDTFVVIPTYNEADNIRALIAELLALPVPVGVIVVDDNSPDNTGSLVRQMQANDPDRIHLISRPGKLGLGTAYVAGFELALGQLGAGRVLSMDADFSHLPGYIPAMLELSRTTHIVIGSRYVPGGGTVHWPASRRLLSWGANTFARVLLGLNAHDTTAGFRLYQRQVLEVVPPRSIKSSGYSYLVEMLFQCERMGFSVGEIPILFEDRRQGTSKISSREIVRAILTVLRLSPRRMWRRPALRSVART
jgi:dolichol-phosphate mannosyltransferase